MQDRGGDDVIAIAQASQQRRDLGGMHDEYGAVAIAMLVAMMRAREPQRMLGLGQVLGEVKGQPRGHLGRAGRGQRPPWRFDRPSESRRGARDLRPNPSSGNTSITSHVTRPFTMVGRPSRMAGALLPQTSTATVDQFRDRHSLPPTALCRRATARGRRMAGFLARRLSSGISRGTLLPLGEQQLSWPQYRRGNEGARIGSCRRDGCRIDRLSSAAGCAKVDNESSVSSLSGSASRFRVGV